MDANSGGVAQQDSESSAVNEILGISLPKRSQPVPIPPSSNRFIPPGYEKSNVFHGGDSVHSSIERGASSPLERRQSFRDKLKQRVDFNPSNTTSESSPSSRPRFLNTNKKAAKAKEHFAKGPDGTSGFHFTRRVTAEPKDLAGSPSAVPTPKSSPSSSPVGSPPTTPASSLSAHSPVFTSALSASPVLRSTSSPVRRSSMTQPSAPRSSNSSPALLPFRSQQQQYGQNLPPLELPHQASEQAFFSQFNSQPQHIPTSSQGLQRRSSSTTSSSTSTSTPSFQSSPYLTSRESSSRQQSSPSPVSTSIFGGDPFFTPFAFGTTQAQQQQIVSQQQSAAQQPSSRASRRYSNEGGGTLPTGTPVVVIPQLPEEPVPTKSSGGNNGNRGSSSYYYPPSLSMVPVPISLTQQSGTGERGPGSGGLSAPAHPSYAPELRRISSDQSSNRSSRGGGMGTSPDHSPDETPSPTIQQQNPTRSPPLYKYQKKVTPSQSPGQSPLDPVPLARAQSAEQQSSSPSYTRQHSDNSPLKSSGSPILQYKPIQQGSSSTQVPKSYGQPLQRERAGSSDQQTQQQQKKENESSNSTSNNNSGRPIFQPVWKPKAKTDTEKLKAEIEQDKINDEIEQQRLKKIQEQQRIAQETAKQLEKAKEQERLRQGALDEEEKRLERERQKAKELERLRQSELDEDEKRRERERLRALERRQELERVEAEQRAFQKQKQLEEAKEQARIAELERQAKQRAAEQRHELELAYEQQRYQQELQAFEKLKEFERVEKEKIAKQLELEEHNQQQAQQPPKPSTSSSVLEAGWKTKEFVPAPVVMIDKKTYDPPLARAWPMTVPPQSVEQEWETVPSHHEWDTTSLSQKLQSSTLSTTFPPLSQVNPKVKSGMKQPTMDKKGQESSNWEPQKEDVEKQAALLYFFSETQDKTKSSSPLMGKTEKQLESFREAMSSSSTKSIKKPEDPTPKPAFIKPIPTTSIPPKKVFEPEERVETEERAEPKKETKKFIPFNQKAVDRSAGIKLTPSILESNLQDQRDELMALRSIFDADFQKEGDKPESPLSPSDIFRIKIKPVGAGNSFIELRFSYPPNYPSDGPPAVSVSAEGWLTPYAIQLLQHNLDKLLKESEGQVVVYTLATWMQEESWSYLMSRSSYSNPIVVHFSPLPQRRSVSKPLEPTAKAFVPQQQQQPQPIKYQRGHPLTVTEGKSKITIVAFCARIRTLTQVQQLIREIKEKQKEKPTSPKLQGHTEQYLVAYRFASTDRAPVSEGADGDEYASGGSSESILRLLQKLNLYDISVVVRLRWPSPPGGDVYKKMLAYISTLLKPGGQLEGVG